MKIKTSLLLLVVVLCLAACKKDNYSLPPETQTGAGTFGCKINGKVWVPKGADYNSGQNAIANYQLVYASNEGYSFSTSATDYDSNPITFFALGVDSIRLYEGLKLPLTTGLPGHAGATYWIGTDFWKRYITSDSNRGEIIFKKFDESSRIASGTFWFDAQNSFGELIHVTEGRFDVKFTR